MTSPTYPHWGARAFDIDTLIALFGTPAQVAARAVLTRKMRDMMRDWLRLIEALVRRALLLDALALVACGVSALSRAMIRTRSRAEVAPRIEGNNPAVWRVSFPISPPARAPMQRSGETNCFARLFAHEDDRYPRIKRALTRGPSPRPEVCAAPCTHQKTARHPRDARPLAGRLEALIRVVANPAPHAARLARRLARPGGNGVAARILVRPPRSLADPHGQAIEAAQTACEAARAALNSS